MLELTAMVFANVTVRAILASEVICQMQQLGSRQLESIWSVWEVEALPRVMFSVRLASVPSQVNGFGLGLTGVVNTIKVTRTARPSLCTRRM